MISHMRFHATPKCLACEGISRVLSRRFADLVVRGPGGGRRSDGCDRWCLGEPTRGFADALAYRYDRQASTSARTGRARGSCATGHWAIPGSLYRWPAWVAITLAGGWTCPPPVPWWMPLSRPESPCWTRPTATA